MSIRLKKIYLTLSVYFVLFMISSDLSADFSSQVEIPVTKYQLPNGVRVLLNSNKSDSLCGYLFGIPIGSRHERKGITGISHMFEHLMFKGTEKYPHFFKTHAEHGVIRTNAFTSFDYTGYTAGFPCDKMELILDMESDRFTNLTLTQEDLDKERQVVQEERRRSIDNSPTGRLFEVFLDTVFVKHSYRWPIIGYSEDIANYTLKDLKEWYKTYYSPNNSVLVLSGNFSKSKVKKLIQKYFGTLKPVSLPKENIIKEPAQQKARSVSLKKEVQSSHVFMGFKIGASGTKTFLALEMLASILGSGESSRLYKKLVRDKKLVSFISADTLDTAQESLFYISYPLLDKSKEQEVKSIIQQEIQKVFENPVSDRELGKVKNEKWFRLVSSLKRSHSRTYNLWKNELIYKDYKKTYRDIDEIDKISPQYIQEVSKKYLKPEQISYVILEPIK